MGRLNGYGLAHLLLMGATTDFTGSPLEHLAGDGLYHHFRPLYNGHIIANVEMTRDVETVSLRKDWRLHRVWPPVYCKSRSAGALLLRRSAQRNRLANSVCIRANRGGMSIIPLYAELTAGAIR